MNKRHSTFSIAAILAASVLALQAPLANAAGNTAAGASSSATVGSADNQRGIPGVEVNVGRDASDRGLPGVEMNIGREGDQRNLGTRSAGAGANMRTEADRRDGGTMRAEADRRDGGTRAMGAGAAGMNRDATMSRRARADRG